MANPWIVWWTLIPNNLVGGSVTESGKGERQECKWGSLQIIGSIVLPVSFGSWSAEQEFLVTQVKLSGPILGVDFLIQQSMVVDLPRREMRWPGGLVQLKTPAADQRCFVAFTRM